MEEYLDILTRVETMSLKELHKCSKIYDIKDCSDISDLRGKLLLTILKEKNFVINTSFFIKDFQEKKELLFREDELRRRYLESCLAKVESIYENIRGLGRIRTPEGIDVIEKDDPLVTVINNEFDNIQDQFKLKKELISKKPNCSILICGDSGAGKSSFINLLLNEPLLPTSIRSNTACQVKLTYHKHERAEILDLDGNIITIEKKDFKVNLKPYLENIEDRTQLSCKSAIIYLNCPILEGGLDIYDTIGLGETQLFNEELTKDLKDITGVLFLLKKNNPIGDDIVGGLSKIINYMAKNRFPGGSMHFIVNMCDLLDESKEKHLLKMNFREQIQDKCTGLSPDITSFSTKRELFLQENKYMSKDYEDIMTRIYQLHLNSINTNTVSIFEFLFRFAWKTIEYINESEQCAGATNVEKKDFILKLRNLSNNRKSLHKAFKRQNEGFLKDTYQKYKDKIQNYFKSEYTMINVVTEVVNRQEELFGMTVSNEVDKEINDMTKDAILKNLQKFIEEENMLKNCYDKMFTSFLYQFEEHQKKDEISHQENNGHRKTIVNYIKVDLATMVISDFNDLIQLPMHQRKILQIFGPIMVPRIVFKDSIISFIMTKINLENIKRFYENTRSYVTKRSASSYRTFMNERKNLKIIMDILFEEPKQVTKHFETYLADDINHLRKNIDLLNDDLRNKDRVIQTYKDIKDKVENVISELCKISLLYLQKDKYDIMRNEMEIEPFVQHQQNSKNDPILFNRSRLLYCGHFQDTPLVDLGILVYRNVDGKSWTDLHAEYMKHKEISKRFTNLGNSEQMNCFMAMTCHILSSISDMQDVKPMFAVNWVDHSLKTYIEEYKLSIEKDQERDMNLHAEIKRLLCQILNGLSYLHSQRLVHYDLTRDSIGYDSTHSTIKLSSISLETCVKIDHFSKSQNYVHEVAHFPLQILQRKFREKYTSKSDIYCLGTILYQLWADIHPFSDIIQNRNINTIEKFVKILKSTKLDKILLPHMFQGFFAMMVYTWVTLCWENMHTADDLYNMMETEKSL